LNQTKSTANNFLVSILLNFHFRNHSQRNNIYILQKRRRRNFKPKKKPKKRRYGPTRQGHIKPFLKPHSNKSHPAQPLSSQPLSLWCPIKLHSRGNNGGVRTSRYNVFRQWSYIRSSQKDQWGSQKSWLLEPSLSNPLWRTPSWSTQFSFLSRVLSLFSLSICLLEWDFVFFGCFSD